MVETQNVSVTRRVRSIYQQLSDKEKQIADYILDQPASIIHSTINQVSDDLNVADATVFRFCKRLGFKGYQALKIALASEIVNPIKDIHETISVEDSELEIVQKVFQSNINALEYTREVQDSGNFQEAVQLLVQSNQVHFYGNGGSGIVALDGQHKFMRTGLPSYAQTDTHMQLMAVSQLTKNDTAVFISHTGANKDLLEVVELAIENNVQTIGITNYAKSPLNKLVDVCLYTASQETEFRSEALSSRIAELSLIDALYVNYSIKKADQSKQALTQMRNAISRKRM